MGVENKRAVMKALIKLRLAEAFSGLGRRRKRSAAAVSGGVGRIILYAALALLVMFSLGTTFFGIGISLAEFGMMELYWPIVFILAFILCFVGSVFIAQHQIFEAKDNDLMFSLPIPPRMLLVSRVLSLILVNYYYESMIIVPGAVVYGVTYGYGPLGILFLILSVLLLPLMVVTLSMIFGYLIAAVSSRLKNSRIVGLILSVAAFAAYMYFIATWPDRLGKLAENGTEVASGLKRGIPPAWHFGNAVHGQDAVSFLLFAMMCVVPFVIACYVIGRNFVRIATTQRGMNKVEYKGGAMKAGGSFAALVKMETGRFTGSNVYMLNGALGLVFVLILAGASVLKSKEFSAAVPSVEGMGAEAFIGPLVALIFLFLGATVFISAATISLDGYTLWIPKSLPLSGREILLAKAMPHILISVPFFFVSAIIIQFALPMDPLWRVGVVVLPLIGTVHNALMGVVINLRFPKFDWLTEAHAVKQGLAPMLAMLLSALPPIVMLLALGVLVLGLGLPGWVLFAGMVVLYAVLILVWYILIRGWGEERLRKI